MTIPTPFFKKIFNFDRFFLLYEKACTETGTRFLSALRNTLFEKNGGTRRAETEWAETGRAETGRDEAGRALTGRAETRRGEPKRGEP